jgi:glycine cleavage system H lipoate-binding protein
MISEKYFTEKHEWIDVDDGNTQGTVGITDYAQV